MEDLFARAPFTDPLPSYVPSLYPIFPYSYLLFSLIVPDNHRYVLSDPLQIRGVKNRVRRHVLAPAPFKHGLMPHSKSIRGFFTSMIEPKQEIEDKTSEYGQAYEAYLAQNFDGALSLLAALPKGHSDEHHAWTLKGRIESLKGQLVEAMQSLQHALTLSHEKNPMAWYYKAAVHEMLLDHARAKECLARCVELESLVVASVDYAGHLTIEATSFTELHWALSLCDSCLSVEPNLESAIFWKAYTLVRIGNHQSLMQASAFLQDYFNSLTITKDASTSTMPQSADVSPSLQHRKPGPYFSWLLSLMGDLELHFQRNLLAKYYYIAALYHASGLPGGHEALTGVQTQAEAAASLLRLPSDLYLPSSGVPFPVEMDDKAIYSLVHIHNTMGELEEAYRLLHWMVSYHEHVLASSTATSQLNQLHDVPSTHSPAQGAANDNRRVTVTKQVEARSSSSSPLSLHASLPALSLPSWFIPSSDSEAGPSSSAARITAVQAPKSRAGLPLHLDEDPYALPYLSKLNGHHFDLYMSMIQGEVHARKLAQMLGRKSEAPTILAPHPTPPRVLPWSRKLESQRYSTYSNMQEVVGDMTGAIESQQRAYAKSEALTETMGRSPAATAAAGGHKRPSQHHLEEVMVLALLQRSAALFAHAIDTLDHALQSLPQDEISLVLRYLKLSLLVDKGDAAAADTLRTEIELLASLSLQLLPDTPLDAMLRPYRAYSLLKAGVWNKGEAEYEACLSNQEKLTFPELAIYMHFVLAHCAHLLWMHHKTHFDNHAVKVEFYRRQEVVHLSGVLHATPPPTPPTATSPIPHHPHIIHAAYTAAKFDRIPVALELLNALLMGQPGHVEARRWFASFQQRWGLTSLLQGSPNPPEVIYPEVEKEYTVAQHEVVAQGRRAAAFREYSFLTHLLPSCARAWLALGVLVQEAGDDAAALAYYQKAQEALMGPEESKHEACALAGLTLLSMQRYDEGLAKLESAISGPQYSNATSWRWWRPMKSARPCAMRISNVPRSRRGCGMTRRAGIHSIPPFAPYSASSKASTTIPP